MSDTPAAIPGDTDDLNAFTSLFSGKVQESSETEMTEEVDEPEAEAEAEAETEESEATEASETDPAAEDESEAEEPAGKKPKSKFQERIDELTAARKTAERDAELARQELAAERRKLEAQKASLDAQKAETKSEVPAPTDNKGPTPDDKGEDGSEKYPLGELDPLFIRDLTRWTIKQETELHRVAQEERARAEQQRVATETLNQEWSERVEKVEKTIPDYRETVRTMLGTFESLPPQYGEYLASTIKTMEHGPEVLYYLSNNLPEARKIVESGAVKATIALGRLEAQFGQQAARPAKKVTATKEPPKPVRGTSGKFSVNADTDDLAAFEKAFLRK